LTETEELPKKCVYIGATLKAKELGVVPTLKETGVDGYRLAVRGEDVFIVSAGREGCIYGVYGFFEKVLGTEFYAVDEWYIPQTQETMLFEKDIDRKPDIDKRVRNIEWTNRDRMTERRLGFNESNGLPWVVFGHSYFRLIPKEKYYDEHPDFYSPNRSQLCLSNPELVDVMIDEVIKRLTPQEFERGDILAFSIGHEDNGSFCNCSRCKEGIKKYGGKAGVMMRFINPVADAVNEFMKKNYPNKTLKIDTFGYGPTIDPPVKWNKDGSCSPVDASVIAHENVGIMLAPLGSDWAHSLLDAKNNGRTRSSLIGWSALKPDLLVWTYDGVFDDFVPMDNWKYLQESYRIFKKFKVVSLFDESAMRGRQFENMCHYVRGKLMWDLSLDMEELVQKFMRGYYKEAANTVYEYYKMFRAHTENLEKEYEKKGQQLHYRSFIRTQPYWKSEDFWSKEYLETALALFEDGKRNLKDTGRTGSLNRLEVEMLSPIYLLLEIYGYALEKARLKEYVDFFERVCEYNGLSYYAEHGPSHVLTVFKKLVHWRALLEE
jgi:hypothetical protein